MPYIYQADLYCDDCGRHIRDTLDEQGKRPADAGDHSSFDSDEYPKYVANVGESDCPDHCGSHEHCLNARTLPSGQKIGVLLHTDLTTAGVEYVREAIEEGGEVAEFWAEEFSDYLD